MKLNRLCRIFIVTLLITSIASSSLIFADSKNTTTEGIKIRNIISKDYKSQKDIKSNKEFVVIDDDVSNNDVTDNTITMIDGDSFNQSTDEDKLKIKEELKKDFSNHKTILVYIQPDGKKSSNDIYKMLDINGVTITPIDKDALENEKRLVAYSLTLEENGPQISMYYAKPDSDITDINKHMDFIIDSYKKNMENRKTVENQVSEKTGLSTQSTANEDIPPVDMNFDCGLSGDDACGSFQMTTYFQKVAHYDDCSLWDVRGSNTTTSAFHTSSSWFITDFLSTSYSVGGISGESLIQNGLNTTNSGHSADVSLDSGGVVGFSYSTSFNDVDCIADYHPIDGAYARWMFDYYRGMWFGVPDPAAYSYTTEPAARYKNYYGSFLIDIGSTITYWSKSNGDIQEKYTGTYRIRLEDR